MANCHTCKNGIIDHEYEIMVYGQPTLTDALLCGNTTLKDLYYNRNNKKGKPINTDTLAPVLAGNSYGYCRGKFYDECQSILITEDDVERDIMNEM
jgi:hypothetical protein